MIEIDIDESTHPAKQMLSVHVIDNALDEETRNEYISYINANKSMSSYIDASNNICDRSEIWVKNAYNDIIKEKSVISSIFQIAAKVVDLSATVGYDYWVVVESNEFVWHIDRDEKLYKSSRETKPAMCTIVYFPMVDSSQGGGNMIIKLASLLSDNDIQDIVIKPKNNRLIVIPGGTVYSYIPFTSSKIILNINPFSYDVWASGEVGESQQTVNLPPSAE